MSAIFSFFFLFRVFSSLTVEGSQSANLYTLGPILNSSRGGGVGWRKEGRWGLTRNIAFLIYFLL